MMDILGFTVDLDRAIEGLGRDVRQSSGVTRSLIISFLADRGIDSDYLSTGRSRAFVRRRVDNVADNLDNVMFPRTLRATNRLAVEQVRMIANVYNQAFVDEDGDPIRGGVLEVPNNDRLMRATSRARFDGMTALAAANVITTRLCNAVNNTVRLATQGTYTNADIIDRVGRARSTGTPTAALSRSMQLLIKDYARNASNLARLELFSANKELFPFIQHISVLDGATTDRCIANAGLIWRNDESREPVGHTIPFEPPPLHFGCRSELIGVLASESEINDMGYEVADNFKDVVGKPLQGVSYRDFLTSQTKARQREILGATKFELFDSGRITLRQLVSNSGRPLSVAELRRRYEE